MFTAEAATTHAFAYRNARPSTCQPIGRPIAMLKRKFKRFLYRHIIPYAGLMAVKALSATYRVRIVDAANESDTLDRYKSLVYASWHQRFFPGIAFFSSRRPIAIMISQSRDGESIARVVDMLGWRAVRGSSSRGGQEALQTLQRMSADGCRIGHIVDGPQGPAGVVKAGLLAIAQHAGIPVVPTVTSGQNRWVCNSWDRFMIPKPFSRVIIRFGRPILIPKGLGNDAFEEQRLQVEKEMRRLYEETDRIWDSPEKIKTVFHGTTKRMKFMNRGKRCT